MTVLDQVVEGFRSRTWVRAFVAQHATVGRTASQLAKEHGVSVGSLSSMLKRACDVGILRRVPGRGPRGGFVYYAKKTRKMPF